MRNLLTLVSLLVLLTAWNTGSLAADENQQSGVETSAEHQSEQGAEHGKAYAGSKEKKLKEEKVNKKDDEDEEDEDDEDEDEDDDEEEDDEDEEDKVKKSKK